MKNPSSAGAMYGGLKIFNRRNMGMNKLVKINKKIERAVVFGYKSIENAVVSGYKAVENGVVSSYKKIENKFVDIFLTNNGSVGKSRMTGMGRNGKN
jgi:hypothetical protein